MEGILFGECDMKPKWCKVCTEEEPMVHLKCLKSPGIDPTMGDAAYYQSTQAEYIKGNKVKHAFYRCVQLTGPTEQPAQSRWYQHFQAGGEIPIFLWACSKRLGLSATLKPVWFEVCMCWQSWTPLTVSYRYITWTNNYVWECTVTSWQSAT